MASALAHHILVVQHPLVQHARRMFVSQLARLHLTTSISLVPRKAVLLRATRWQARKLFLPALRRTSKLWAAWSKLAQVPVLARHVAGVAELSLHWKQRSAHPWLLQTAAPLTKPVAVATKVTTLMMLALRVARTRATVAMLARLKQVAKGAGMRGAEHGTNALPPQNSRPLGTATCQTKSLLMGLYLHATVRRRMLHPMRHWVAASEVHGMRMLAIALQRAARRPHLPDMAMVAAQICELVLQAPLVPACKPSLLQRRTGLAPVAARHRMQVRTLQRCQRLLPPGATARSRLRG
jgi:hypothetical protein